MVQEARLEKLDAGLTPVTDGWFVVSIPDAAWVTPSGELGRTSLGVTTAIPTLTRAGAVSSAGRAGDF